MSGVNEIIIRARCCSSARQGKLMKHPTAQAKTDQEPVYSVDEYARQLGLTVAETSAIIDRIRLEFDNPSLEDQDGVPEVPPTAGPSKFTF